MSRRRLVQLLVPAVLAFGSGCSEAEVVSELRSLQGSEDAVFLCRDADGVGHPFSECPDRDATDDADASKDLSIFALVSQTLTNELAVVDVSRGEVVDVDPSTPGFGFLRVGGRPVSMVSSPGGTASFVATAEVGHNGIFALPTECVTAPSSDEAVRDLTTWPACRLDATPGEMAMVIEPLRDGDVPTHCGGAELQSQESRERPDGASCWTDLASEGGKSGRRKLVLALPDLGQLAVIDAQTLLNQAPGSFPPCEIEQTLDLDALVPEGVAQQLPPDLTQPLDPETTCSELPTPLPPPPSPRAPRPAGFALADDRLYVADEAAPVIHVIDTSSACNLTALPSLLPMSVREPQRVVTTRRVAVSPLTPSGKQFVYAIDAEDQPGASVMVFDVSPPSDLGPGSTDPTPIVRPGSPEVPGEKPDRLALSASAKDVTFAYRDLPYVDPATGVGTFGTFCDPDPGASKDSPGALARPSADFLSGARPGLLRGLFGFILLSNGTIAVVDVEDFDAPCRRPIQANPEARPDFRGCAGDPAVGFFTEDRNADGPPTVTDEVSCRIVEPHRFRGSTLAVTNPEVGVRAPALRGFPQLSLPPAAASSPPEARPRLLAVPFVGVDGNAVQSDVFVGSTRYSSGDDGDQQLPTDPNSRLSERAQSLNSLVLPPLEPRAYAAEDTVTLTYEGSYAGDRTSGFLQEGGVLEDASLSFCAAGVYDEAAMTDYAQRELGLSADDALAFGAEHADYVQLTTALLPEDSAYWAADSERSYEYCFSKFKAHDAETLALQRDFRVVAAFAGQLQLAPREADVTLDDALGCFPTANTYRLRGGAHWVLLHTSTGFNHDVVASGEDSRCIRSCSPLKKWAKSRAFEISSRENCRPPGEEGDPLTLRVGCAREDEVACVYDQGAPSDDPGQSSAVRIGGEASECIFDGLTERFAVYRGREPSERDSVFSWQTTGGFSPLFMSLANVSTTVAPQTIQFLEQPELMAVVDGASLGLSLLSLDTLVVTKPSPFY